MKGIHTDAGGTAVVDNYEQFKIDCQYPLGILWLHEEVCIPTVLAGATLQGNKARDIARETSHARRKRSPSSGSYTIAFESKTGEKNRLLQSSDSNSTSNRETENVSKTEKMSSSFLGIIQVDWNGINAKLFAYFVFTLEKQFILLLKNWNLRLIV